MNKKSTELSSKKYPISKLGTKPTLMRKALDRTDLYPILEDMYSHVRELNRYMSKSDKSETGSQLYRVTVEAHNHFALSYYHITMDDIKLEEAYKLLECLESIKFLTDLCFKLKMINLDNKHIEGLRNKIYITIAAIQEQSEKWYQWISCQINNNNVK